VSDYPVRKARRPKARSKGVEQIEATCEACKRRKGNTYYANLSPERKLEVGRKANQRKRERQLREIERMKVSLDKLEHKLDKQHVKLRAARASVPRGVRNGDGADIVPFRMWLLRQHRLHGYSAKDLAAAIGQDEARVRRWLQGFQWNGKHEEPVPIRAINVETVRHIGMQMDEPRLAEELYPHLAK